MANDDIESMGQRLMNAQLHNTAAAALGHKAQSDVYSGHLKARLQQLEDDVAFYKRLLTRPLAEIAQKNVPFRATYNAQLEQLAGWMVSQRSFKELAIDLGMRLGISKDEVVKQGMAGKAAVLNNETKHGNNVAESEFLTLHADVLRAKLKTGS